MAIELGTAATQDSSAFASAAQGTKADSAVQQLQAGTGISIDATDPQKPIVTATTALTGDLPVSTHLGSAYAITNSAPISTLYGGLSQFWIPDVTNAGAATLNADGTGDVNIQRNGVDLVGNELPANVPALVVYNNITASWDLVAVPNALFDLQYTIITASGNFTPLLSGTYVIDGTAGGGGGGAGAPVSGSVATLGFGGQGGGAGEKKTATLTLVGGTAYAVVIGAAGSGGIAGGAAATAGGATTFNGAAFSCVGGVAGAKAPAYFSYVAGSGASSIDGGIGLGDGGGAGGAGLSVDGNGNAGSAGTGYGSGGGGGGGARDTAGTTVHTGGNGGAGMQGVLKVWRVA